MLTVCRNKCCSRRESATRRRRIRFRNATPVRFSKRRTKTAKPDSDVTPNATPVKRKRKAKPRKDEDEDVDNASENPTKDEKNRNQGLGGSQPKPMSTAVDATFAKKSESDDATTTARAECHDRGTEQAGGSSSSSAPNPESPTLKTDLELLSRESSPTVSNDSNIDKSHSTNSTSTDSSTQSLSTVPADTSNASPPISNTLSWAKFLRKHVLFSVFFGFFLTTADHGTTHLARAIRQGVVSTARTAVRMTRGTVRSQTQVDPDAEAYEYAPEIEEYDAEEEARLERLRRERLRVQRERAQDNARTTTRVDFGELPRAPAGVQNSNGELGAESKSAESKYAAHVRRLLYDEHMNYGATGAIGDTYSESMS